MNIIIASIIVSVAILSGAFLIIVTIQDGAERIVNALLAPPPDDGGGEELPFVKRGVTSAHDDKQIFH